MKKTGSKERERQKLVQEVVDSLDAQLSQKGQQITGKLRKLGLLDNDEWVQLTLRAETRKQRSPKRRLLNPEDWNTISLFRWNKRSKYYEPTLRILKSLSKSRNSPITISTDINVGAVKQFWIASKFPYVLMCVSLEPSKWELWDRSSIY